MRVCVLQAKVQKKRFAVWGDRGDCQPLRYSNIFASGSLPPALRMPSAVLAYSEVAASKTIDCFDGFPAELPFVGLLLAILTVIFPPAAANALTS